ncbi:MAG TPA: hypothetical protein VKY74_12935 [Chloroflexia bacterium]|nr:hypothetical protein [Chloroflexia bacterium]
MNQTPSNQDWARRDIIMALLNILLGLVMIAQGMFGGWRGFEMLAGSGLLMLGLVQGWRAVQMRRKRE